MCVSTHFTRTHDHDVTKVLKVMTLLKRVETLTDTRQKSE